VYYQTREEFCHLNIWSNIDPLKVKQRIDTITARLEGVRRKFDPEIETDNFFTQANS
jgi:hypothetical protein